MTRYEKHRNQFRVGARIKLTASQIQLGRILACDVRQGEEGILVHGYIASYRGYKTWQVQFENIVYCIPENFMEVIG